jgi:dTDP-4-dehydrorhamnose 3,5-epimerase-like enzyme
MLILQPKAFGDDRGFFFESFNMREFERVTGLRRSFLQTIIAILAKAYCVGCITNFNTRKGNS